MNYKGIDPDKFQHMMKEKYNGRTDFRGLQLMNANGDIATSSLAYQYATDRLTYIRSRIVEQSFYEVNPSDYFDVIPGEGAFAAQIITQASIKSGQGFQAGKINTAGHNSKLAIADAAVTPFYTLIRNWALAIEYSIFDVQQALFTGTWDPIEAKERARKLDYDLGIQAVSFLGDTDDLTNFPGLYSQSGVNVKLNTLITTNISNMTTAQFSTMVAGLISDFLSNSNQTRFPNTFIIPQDDYAGLAVPLSQTYPNISMLQYLTQAFNMIVPGGNFKIMPSAYGMTAYNGGASISKQRYILMRRDIDTLFMELPVEYQTTAVGTVNNFNFQNVAYAQYSGVTVLKPLELLYYDHT